MWILEEANIWSMTILKSTCLLRDSQMVNKAPVLVYFLNYLNALTWCIKIILGIYGLPRWRSGKESACQCRRCGRRRFDPWIRKIPWRRKWQPSLLLLPEKILWTEEYGRLHPWGHKVPDTTKQLSTHASYYGKNHKNISPPLSSQSFSWSSSWDSALPMPEMQVKSLVGELRFPYAMWCS